MHTACSAPNTRHHAGFPVAPRSVPATARSSASDSFSVPDRAAPRTASGQGAGSPSVACSATARSALSTRERCTALASGADVSGRYAPIG